VQDLYLDSPSSPTTNEVACGVLCLRIIDLIFRLDLADPSPTSEPLASVLLRYADSSANTHGFNHISIIAEFVGYHHHPLAQLLAILILSELERVNTNRSDHRECFLALSLSPFI
jgi:hypothetical protein